LYRMEVTPKIGLLREITLLFVGFLEQMIYT
jgi:hypothetical protein